MIYVFDTNILVHLIRQTADVETQLIRMGCFQSRNQIVISIAATTLLAKGTLVTSDADFEHLDPTFFKVNKILLSR